MRHPRNARRPRLLPGELRRVRWAKLRQAAGRALLWLPLQRWVQTPQAAQFFYERDTYKAETKKYSEDSVL